jgi:hypothetical protein
MAACQVVDRVFLNFIALADLECFDSRCQVFIYCYGSSLVEDAQKDEVGVVQKDEDR